MPNFQILFANSTTPANGVELVFRSTKSITLTAKCISFHPASSKGVTVIHSIPLNNNDKCCTFEYPDPNSSYEKLTFDLQQSGCKGWNVTVDLKEREIDIKESSYQIW